VFEFIVELLLLLFIFFSIFPCDSLLNRLTNDNLVPISAEITEMCKNANLLPGIIKRIFEKAILEPKFGQMYAYLCTTLSLNSRKQNEEASDGGADTTGEKKKKDKVDPFKQLLLDRCQQEFESR
jgi:hypothetical protein